MRSLREIITARTLTQRIEEWRDQPCSHCGERIPEDRRPFLCNCEGAREERARKDADLRERQEILGQEDTKRRRAQAGLVGRLLEMTFETFQETLQPEPYKKATQFTGERGESLILYGPDYGSGKTHLAAAVLNRWINQGGTGRFCELPALLRRLRATFSPDAKESEYRVFASIQETGLLVLDDVGKEKGSEWVWQTLYDLINYRYIRDMPMVITSNLMPRELGEAIGWACLSRLSEKGIFVCVKGEDYRLRGRR